MGPAMVNLRGALLTLLLGCHRTVLSDLTYSPMDSETLVNESTYFNCSSSITSKEIHWFHYPVGVEAHESKSVYAFDKFYKDYEEDFALEKNVSNGAYNLVIKSAKREYAGRYQCQEDRGTGNSGFAQLIVLDAEPECNSNVKPEGVIGSNTCGIQPEDLHLSCSISYHGNIPPALKWVKLGGNEAISENVTKAEQSRGRFTYNLTVKADQIEDKSSFKCQTTKSRASTSTLSETISCTSETVKLLYIFNASSLSVRSIGDVVNCSANTSSQSCQYKWQWYNKEDSQTVSDNRILKVEEEGQYVCEATCDLRDEQCTVIAMFINSSISGTGTMDSGSSSTVSVWLILVAILSFILLLIIFYVIYRKCKSGQKGTFFPCCSRMKAERPGEEETTCLNEVSNQDASPLLKANRNPGELQQENEKEKTGTTKDNPIIIPDNEKVGDVDEKLGMDCDPHPELPYVQSLLSASNKKTGISGLTILNKELYIAFERTSELNVFQAISFSRVRSVVVIGLDNPLDMVSCQVGHCLYISSAQEIYKIDASGKVLTKWPIEDGGGTLSVTYDQTVILSNWKTSVLRAYSADGKFVDQVNFPSEFHPFHAVKTSADQFVVSYEQRMVHSVSIFDANGCIIQSFRGQLKFPKYLAVNSDGRVFVADEKNSRVLMKNPTLDSTKVVLSDKDKLDRPLRICLDENNSRMFVADNKADDIKFMVFRTDVMEDNPVVCDEEGIEYFDALDFTSEKSPKAAEASQQPLEENQQAVDESRGEKRKRPD